jgi:hypothetical protein
MRGALPIVTALLLGAGFMGACSRCGAPRVREELPLGEVLPRRAELVVVIKDAGALGGKLTRLQRLKISGFLAQLQGFSTAEELVTAVMTGLGVDLRSGKGMREAGLVPERGIGFVALDKRKSYAVVGVGDEGRLIGALGGLAKNRLGASERRTSTLGALGVTTFLRPKSPSPELGVVFRGGFAFVGVRLSQEELADAAGVPPSESLAKDEALAASAGRLPPQADVLCYFPEGSVRGLPLLPLGAATVALSLDEGGLSIDGDFPSHAKDAPLWLTPKKDAPDLTPLLPQDAFLALRFTGDPQGAWPLWQTVVGPRVADLVKAAGVDLQADVLDQMQPGAVASLALSPVATLTNVPALDLRRTNPFRYVQLVAVAKAKDEARVDGALKNLFAAAPRLGMQVKELTVGGRPTYMTSYAQGEGVSVVHSGQHVVIGAPLARAAETLSRVDTALGRAAPTRLVQALANSPLSVAVDLTKLSDEVRALPPSAWGVGGFAIKATATRWLDMLSDLKTLDASLASRNGAMELSIRLRVIYP